MSSAEPSHIVLRAYLKDVGSVKVYAGPSQSTALLLQVENGYRFKALWEDKTFQCVELHSGKVGYVRKDMLVPDKDYRGKDSYPPGSQCLRASETETLPIFVVEPVFKDGIVVRAKPDVQSRELFVLGPLQAAFIVETLPFFYELLLPGPTEGFVLRSEGARRDWAHELTTHFGFYGLRRDSTKTIPVRYAPNLQSEYMVLLDVYSRLPVVEEWDGWFKVQLDDGCQGFVPEALGNRTIYADTFVEKPKEGSSALAKAGLVALGLLTAATVGSALREEG
jgi:hypothetical protein